MLSVAISRGTVARSRSPWTPAAQSTTQPGLRQAKLEDEESQGALQWRSTQESMCWG